MNITSKVLFRGAAFWLWLLAPLVFLGFLPSYFSKPAGHTSLLLHVHAVLMLAWLALALVQPLLVRYKQLRLHRILGKASYVLMPLLLVSGWFVIKRTYAGFLVSDEPDSAVSAEQITAANGAIFIPLVFMFWLALFFLLGIIYRRQLVFHATFMLAATLTIIGPSLDRLLYQLNHIFSIENNWANEYGKFLIIDFLLLLVLYTQCRNRYSLKPIFVAIGIYALGQLGYELLPGSGIWDWFVGLVM